MKQPLLPGFEYGDVVRVLDPSIDCGPIPGSVPCIELKFDGVRLAECLFPRIVVLCRCQSEKRKH